MCYPGASSQARAVGKARDKEFSVEGVNLNNLKDTPRQLALTSNMTFSSLPGISLGPARDLTRQYQG